MTEKRSHLIMSRTKKQMNKQKKWLTYLIEIYEEVN